MAEQRPFKPFVEGSIPSALTVSIQLLMCYYHMTAIEPPSQPFTLAREGLIVN